MNAGHTVLKAHVSLLQVLSVRRDVFYYSRERRSEVKVNLPDFRRFAVMGLAVERNVALG